MDLDDELPRIHRNGATGMNQEPCGSETRWSPVPVTEQLVLDQGIGRTSSPYTKR